MGLNVHFKLFAPPDTDAARARQLVHAMRRRAQGFKQSGRVDDVLSIGDDREALRWVPDFGSVPHPWKPGCESAIEIPAEAGFIFPVEVGADCEPLWLGLCRYSKTVSLGGKHYSTERPGWRLRRFSKTQYASLHGWEHFRRCHTAVIDLLDGMRRFGITVEINDEGDYWPRRDMAALRRNLDEMNGLVAAMAGALKDTDGAADIGAPVESPIFRHKHFERLEAEGEAKMGECIWWARRISSDPVD